MSKHDFSLQNVSKTEPKVISAVRQGISERMVAPSPEKYPKKEEIPIHPFPETEMKVKFSENTLEKKKLLTPKATIISQEEMNRKLSEETARYKAATNLTKLKSDDFFLQRRKEKIKEKIGVKETEQNQKEEEQGDLQSPEESQEDLVEVKRGKFNPIYQRASMAVELDEKTANLEEIKGLERETLEGNKVMVDWINKNKSSLEKSQRIEPVLKKKDTQEIAFEEMEKQALKKIEEKISSYLTHNKNKLEEMNKDNKNIKNSEEKIEKNELQTEKKQPINELQEKKQIDKEKIPIKTDNGEKKINIHKKSKEEVEKNEKNNEKNKPITKNRPQKINNLKKNEKKDKHITNLESPEAREAANKMDIKRSKTPTHELKQMKHKDMVLRAKTPEYKTSANKEKFFVSKNKLESQKTDLKNNMNQEDVLDNYSDEKFYQITNIFEESLNEITVKSMQVNIFC